MISGMILFYIIIKYLIEKTISIVLNFKENLVEINRYRIGLKNLISVYLYFYLKILIFNPISNKITVIRSFSLFIIYLFFSFKYIFKKYSDSSYKGLVYFILYLCAFEIAPAAIVMLEAFKYLKI